MGLKIEFFLPVNFILQTLKDKAVCLQTFNRFCTQSFIKAGDLQEKRDKRGILQSQLK